MNTRDTSVDTVRGVAVFFMIASHTIWFLSNDKNAFWNFIRSFGDAVCFITFLFVFGITTYFTIFSKDYSPELRNKALKRIRKLLLAYYLIAFFGILKDLLKNLDVTLIIKILTFQNVPGFTEFLLPFILYSILFLVIRKFIDIRKIFPNKNSLLYLAIIGITLWVLGNILAIGNSNLANPVLSPYLALFTGGYNLLRFPVLQYSIVMLLGIYFGFLVSKQNNNEGTIQGHLANSFLLNGSIITVSTSLILLGSEFYRNITWANMFTRWPPSLLFILSGLSFAFLVLFICRNLQIRILEYFNRIGLHAILLLVFHIAVLRLLELYRISRTSNGLILTLFFIALVNIPLCINVILRQRNQTLSD